MRLTKCTDERAVKCYQDAVDMLPEISKKCNTPEGDALEIKFHQLVQLAYAMDVYEASEYLAYNHLVGVGCPRDLEKGIKYLHEFLSIDFDAVVSPILEELFTLGFESDAITLCSKILSKSKKCFESLDNTGDQERWDASGSFVFLYQELLSEMLRLLSEKKITPELYVAVFESQEFKIADVRIALKMNLQLRTVASANEPSLAVLLRLHEETLELILNDIKAA